VALHAALLMMSGLQKLGMRSAQDAVDLLIAGIADENESSIWSRDADFARMQRLGFVRSHQPA